MHRHRWAQVEPNCPHVHGQALDLVALLANRRGAIAALTGPGVPRLPEYGPPRPARPRPLGPGITAS